MNCSRMLAQRVRVEERLAGQGGVEVADEEFEGRAGGAGEARGLGDAVLDLHGGIDDGQDAVEALHEVPPVSRGAAAPLECAVGAKRLQSGEATSEIT